MRDIDEMHAPPIPLTGTPTSKLPPSDNDRLIIELEFVQGLLNIKYLNYLAVNGYLDQTEFINFLQYLQYWKDPRYCRHMLFPQSLAILDALISDANFRQELKFPSFLDFCHQLQGNHWLISKVERNE